MGRRWSRPPLAAGFGLAWTVVAGGANAATDARDVAGAIPWETVVPMLLQIMLKVALGKNKS